jgi:hypothetical protein
MISHVRFGHFILINDGDDEHEPQCQLLDSRFNVVGFFDGFGTAQEAAKKAFLMKQAADFTEQANRE